MQTIKTFYSLLQKARREFLLIIISGSLISGSEALIHPLLVKAIFDESILRKDFHRFVILTTFYLIFGLLLNILTYFRSLWLKSFENKKILELSSELLNRFYNSDFREVSKNGPGYYISRVFTDVNEGFAPMLHLVDRLLSKIVSVIIFIGVMLYLSWKASLLLFAISPILIYLSHKIGNKIREVTKQERESQGMFLSNLEGAIRAFRMVRSHGLERVTLKSYSKKIKDYIELIFKNFKLSQLYNTLSYMTMNIADFTSLFIGAYYVIKGELTFGGYLAFVNTFWRTLTSINKLFYEFPLLSKYGEILRRISNFLDRERGKYFESHPAIEIKDLTFSYDGKYVFKNLNLTVKKGEKICIVGDNGTGKTTLAHILSGYLKPDSGEIKFPERVASITLPLHFPPVKIKDLGLNPDLVKELGFENFLEKTADELSAGEKQKLGIALALSSDADFFIFDEPLENIDEKSREKVFKLILDHTKGKTLLIIMHGFNEYHKFFDRVINISKI